MDPLAAHPYQAGECECDIGPVVEKLESLLRVP